ncbi:MAG: hemolysin III family protein [Solirubrobacterales bacterium]|nr:hemolysin III family protein [Solirubrobacterales bacterium]MBV8947892.1 hemolysin III family protein [Solirubrobacterales bacterium]MBV9366937.1 hemolysin III family protein [Solirubrobacterales bacterium]MBV9684288.1 hemolysin III family protein [Solirubrobacterales bacterium]MBV9805959.1 hemolysin III family protein [Solirubrobacterales bacterium]
MPAGTLDLSLKPRLRGVLHQWAFAVSLVTGLGLVLEAASVRARLAVAVYALSVSALFGTSALYHRVDWRTLRARRRMRRFDHAMIFALIAGSYTPLSLLVLHGTLGLVILIAVWSAALAGAVFKLVWIDAPGWLGAATYILIGWIAVIATPELVHRLGVPAVAALALGGILYSAGGVIHARRRPDPVPSIFGYHELFHSLVIAAAGLQYAVVAFWIL